jgi:WhiB family redox-sensing transcriptional regulator
VASDLSVFLGDDHDDSASTAYEIQRQREGYTGPVPARRPDPKPEKRVLRIDWRRWRACADEPVSTFVPEADGVTDKHVRKMHKRAKAICADCPVIMSCREFAHEERFPYGVFGGETPAERALAIVRGES